MKNFLLAMIATICLCSTASAQLFKRAQVNNYYGYYPAPVTVVSPSVVYGPRLQYMRSYGPMRFPQYYDPYFYAPQYYVPFHHPYYNRYIGSPYYIPF